MTRHALCVLATFIALLGLASPAWACSCAPSTPEEGFKSAAIVFWGVVEKTEVTGDGFGSLNATFRLKHSFKGAKSKTVVVRTNLGGTACGLDFDEGESYLVFAHTGKSGYGASSCGHTVRMRTKPPSALKPPPARDLTREKKALDPVLRPILETAACSDGTQFGLRFYSNGEFELEREDECARQHVLPKLVVPKLPDTYPFRVRVHYRRGELRTEYEANESIPLLRTSITQTLDRRLPLVHHEDLLVQYQLEAISSYRGVREVEAACRLSGVDATRRYVAKIADDVLTRQTALLDRAYYNCAVLRREWSTAAKLAANLKEYEGRAFAGDVRAKTAQGLTDLPLERSLAELGFSAAEVLRNARRSSVWVDDPIMLDLVAQALLERPGGATDRDRQLAARAFARAGFLSEPRNLGYLQRAVQLGGEAIVEELEREQQNSRSRLQKQAEQAFERHTSKGKTLPTPPR